MGDAIPTHPHGSLYRNLGCCLSGGGEGGSRVGGPWRSPPPSLPKCNIQKDLQKCTTLTLIAYTFAIMSEDRQCNSSFWPNHEVFPATPAPQAGIDATQSSQVHPMCMLSVVHLRGSALIRPTKAPSLLCMYNTVECWIVAPYPVYLLAVFALLLLADGPPLTSSLTSVL